MTRSTDRRTIFKLLTSLQKFARNWIQCTALRLSKEQELEWISFPFERLLLGIKYDWLKYQNFEPRLQSNDSHIIQFGQHQYVRFLLENSRFDELNSRISDVLRQIKGSYEWADTYRTPIYNLVNLCQTNWLYMWDHCARVSGMECEETTRILEQRGISDFHGPLRLVNDSTRWAYCPSHLSNNEVWFRLYTCYHGCANMGNSDPDAYLPLQKSISHQIYEQWRYLDKWYRHPIELQLKNGTGQKPTKWLTRIPLANMSTFERGWSDPQSINFISGSGRAPLVWNHEDLNSVMEFLKNI